MSHLTGTGERNALYIEREAIAATREAVAERRERFATAPDYTPERNAIRDRKRAANDYCDELDATINRHFGYQRNANHPAIKAAIGLTIANLQAQELIAKVEEAEAEEVFNRVIIRGEAV